MHRREMLVSKQRYDDGTQLCWQKPLTPSVFLKTSITDHYMSVLGAKNAVFIL